MKQSILLVNCYREQAEEKIEGYHGWLAAAAAAAGSELEVSDTSDRDGIVMAGEIDAVIVSGSQKMAGAGEAEAGLVAFLKSNRRPLLGICYGHQALARAWGCLVERDGQKHLGDEEVFLRAGEGLFAGFPRVFKMRESHEEIVVRDNALERNFSILAESGGGLVEAIAHRDLPLYGVQFHPEKSGELGIKLLMNFLKMLTD
jgi:para-aminobenzoate synthetase component 2